MENQNVLPTSEMLTRAYAALKFSSDETNEALNNLASLQRLAILTELVKDLTKEEAIGLSKAAGFPVGAEKQKFVEQLMEKRKNNDGFISRIKNAADKVLAEHVAYLKTRGDENQKKEISRILG